MDQARKITDELLEETEKRINKLYAEAYKGISKKWNAYMKSHAPKVEKALIELQEALESNDRDRIAKAREHYAHTVRNVTVNDERFRAMRDEVVEKISHVNEVALDYVNDSMAKVYTVNYNAFGTQKVAGYSFALVNENAVKELAMSDDLLLPKKKVDIPKDEAWNKKNINSQMFQGILQGEDLTKISNRIFPEIMAKTDLTGKTKKEIAGIIKKNRDAAIRNARTMFTSAENKGRQDSFEKASEDGVIMEREWIAAHDSHTRAWHLDLHGKRVAVDEPWENDYGKIMYPGDPTADPANVYNCFVANTHVGLNSDVERSYKHKYDGELVTIKTAGGVQFTCTPNHPILTLDGWVGAKSLNNGQDLLIARLSEDNALRVDPNINHAFPTIDTIHKFSDEVTTQRACGLRVNFHGDVPTSDVEIITQKRFLRTDFNTVRGKKVNKVLLKHPDVPFALQGSFMEHFGRVCQSSLSFICRLCEPLAFFFARLRHTKIHGLRPVALFNSGRVQAVYDNTPGNIELLSKCLDGFTGIVFADKIVDVNVNFSHCDVFNLQTGTGYYFVNSIISNVSRKNNDIFAIAHNCRCAIRAHVKGFRWNNAS